MIFQLTPYKKNFSAKSASSLMTTRIPVVGDTSSIAEIKQFVLHNVKLFDAFYYIYVVDNKKKLIGVLSLRELLDSPDTAKVKTVMTKEVISVHPHTHQERVGLLALKANVKMIPVISKSGLLIGAIAPDVILRVLDSEAVENLLRLGGVSYKPSGFDDVFNLTIFTSIKHRLPWLIIGLIGGLLAAGIVNGFEDFLSTNIILAAFIPLIVYMADAVGTQMEAFIIRDLAINPQLKFFKYIGKQGAVVAIIGLVISVLLYLATTVIYHQPAVSFAVSVALFIAIITSLVTGLVVPYLFGKLKQDPANASGPIATVIQDVLSVLVYFIVASLLI